jgi:hypothetical protein
MDFPTSPPTSMSSTLKKISEREDQYLYVARRTFINLFLGVTYLYRDASSLKN